jgi:C4-type Zn-finger protein
MQMNEALASKANLTSVQGILDRLDNNRESAMYSTQEMSNMVSTLREEITTKVGMKEVRAFLPPLCL